MEAVRSCVSKPFECDFPGCQKTFTYKSELKKHTESHSALKNLKCPQPGCWKYFKRADTLENHIRIHTGEKPFCCQEPGCSERFANKAGLRYHTLKHKNVKNYACDFPNCTKSFLTLAQLKQHEQSGCHLPKIIHTIQSADMNSTGHSTTSDLVEPNFFQADELVFEGDRNAKRIKLSEYEYTCPGFPVEFNPLIFPSFPTINSYGMF